MKWSRLMQYYEASYAADQRKIDELFEDFLQNPDLYFGAPSMRDALREISLHSNVSEEIISIANSALIDAGEM